MSKILIVDDDPSMNAALMGVIRHLGHAMQSCTTLKAGLTLARQDNELDLVLLDVRLPDGDGIEALPSFRQTPSRPEVIIITGFANLAGAETALKSGAWDYLRKPPSLDDIKLCISRALEYRAQKEKPECPILLKRERIIGGSPQLLAALEKAALAARSDASVLISGETGTGKECFADLIHSNSRRKAENFVAVDCGAMPVNLVESLLFGHEKGAFTGAERRREGLIKKADGGTLFLDEIGELSLTVQTRLLRVLQERSFRPLGSDSTVCSDFRIIAATNRDLESMARDGDFREDLLYRFKTIEINLPPLRERTGDVLDLATFFAKSVCEKEGLTLKGFSDCFFETLIAYDWPGNVRELQRAVEQAVISASWDKIIYSYHLPAGIRLFQTKSCLNDESQTISQNQLLPNFKSFQQSSVRDYLVKLMQTASGDKSLACEISGLSQSYLYKLLKDYRIQL